MIRMVGHFEELAVSAPSVPSPDPVQPRGGARKFHGGRGFDDFAVGAIEQPFP